MNERYSPKEPQENRFVTYKVLRRLASYVQAEQQEERRKVGQAKRIVLSIAMGILYPVPGAFFLQLVLQKEFPLRTQHGAVLFILMWVMACLVPLLWKRNDRKST